MFVFASPAAGKTPMPSCMPKGFLKLALCLTIIVAIPACSGDHLNIDMPGKWVCTQVEFQTTFEFKPDGTFTKTVKTVKDLPTPAELDGTWKLDKDLKLHLKFKAGGEETHQIVVNAGIPSFDGDANQVFYKKL
jgi:hypothetical protein